MPINVLKKMGADDVSTGKSVMIYGKSKAGKTLGCIPLKAKTLYIQIEPNAPKSELLALGRSVDHIDVIEWAQVKRDADGKRVLDANGNPEMLPNITYVEFREFMNNPNKNIIPYGYEYIVIDSFTELMKLCHKEITASTGGAKQGKILGEYQQASMQDYGIVVGIMETFAKSLKNLTALGINVIMIAQEGIDEKTGCAIPSLVGKKLILSLPYYIDLVGYVTEGVKVNPDLSVKPAVVKFEEVKGLYEAGWRGTTQWRDKPHKLEIESIIKKATMTEEEAKRILSKSR